jgi:hypothetical protein
MQNTLIEANGIFKMQEKSTGLWNVLLTLRQKLLSGAKVLLRFPKHKELSKCKL